MRIPFGTSTQWRATISSFFISSFFFNFYNSDISIFSLQLYWFGLSIYFFWHQNWCSSYYCHGYVHISRSPFIASNNKFTIFIANLFRAKLNSVTSFFSQYLNMHLKTLRTRLLGVVIFAYKFLNGYRHFDSSKSVETTFDECFLTEKSYY